MFKFTIPPTESHIKLHIAMSFQYDTVHEAVHIVNTLLESNVGNCFLRYCFSFGKNEHYEGNNHELIYFRLTFQCDSCYILTLST